MATPRADGAYADQRDRGGVADGELARPDDRGPQGGGLHREPAVRAAQRVGRPAGGRPVRVERGRKDQWTGGTCRAGRAAGRRARCSGPTSTRWCIPGSRATCWSRVLATRSRPAARRANLRESSSARRAAVKAAQARGVSSRMPASGALESRTATAVPGRPRPRRSWTCRAVAALHKSDFDAVGIGAAMAALPPAGVAGIQRGHPGLLSGARPAGFNRSRWRSERSARPLQRVQGLRAG